MIHRLACFNNLQEFVIFNLLKKIKHGAHCPEKSWNVLECPEKY